MEQFKKLKENIESLEIRAEHAKNRRHSGNDFDTKQEYLQRGKFIAYGHVISLINNILNKQQ